MTDSDSPEGKQSTEESCESNPDLGATSARIISSQELFADSEVLLISHSGKLYQLRKTNNGGLILTK